MKKYLLSAAGFVLLASTLTAMEGEKEGDESPPSTPPMVQSNLERKERDESLSSTLSKTLNVEEKFEDLKRDPHSYEPKGGAFGLFTEPALKTEAIEELLRTVSGSYEDLRKHLENKYIIELALGKAQQELKEEKEKFEKEKAAREALESELSVAKARAEFLKTKEQSLLLEANKKDAAMMLDQKRKEFLEQENLELKQIIADFAANEKAIEKLLGENEDYAGILLTLPEKGKDGSETTHKNIKSAIEGNLIRISELKEKNSELERFRKETEEKILQLEEAIEANDYYTQILNMIYDEEVSDEDLALFIWSVRTVQGVDLDQLSEGRDIRLIEALIYVSRPYDERPKGEVSCTYDDAFRTLGNQFTPRGLAWVGSDLKIEECIYNGSKFAEESADVARYAKDKFNYKKQH